MSSGHHKIARLPARSRLAGWLVAANLLSDRILACWLAGLVGRAQCSQPCGRMFELRPGWGVDVVGETEGRPCKGCGRERGCGAATNTWTTRSYGSPQGARI